MNIRFLSIVILVLVLLRSTSTFALNMAQFSTICDSTSGDCGDHPVVQAYIGGALDLLATLDEETGYLDKLYCKEPKALFGIPSIVRFMQEHSEEYLTRNAMLLVVRYFEENGGC